MGAATNCIAESDNTFNHRGAENTEEFWTECVAGLFLWQSSVKISRLRDGISAVFWHHCYRLALLLIKLSSGILMTKHF